MSEFEMQPRRRRKPVPKWKRFLRRYGSSLMLVALVICCVGMVAFTVVSVSAMLNAHNEKLEQLEKPPVSTTIPTTKGLDPEEVALALAEADKLAAGYDYEGAIALLESVTCYEESSENKAKIDAYDALDEALVSYDDLDNITHIFFHSLIVDPERAFDGDIDQNGYNMYMVTVDEFNKILQSMYDRGFVLVSPYDIAY